MIYLAALPFAAVIVLAVYWAMGELSIHYSEIF